MSTPSVSSFYRLSRGRCSWLLLTLALLVGGQTLALSHWHGDPLEIQAGQRAGDNAPTHKSKIVDSVCSLCVYASTAMAAIASSIWLMTIPLFAAVWFTCRVSVRRAAVRFNDSRAPPMLLI